MPRTPVDDARPSSALLAAAAAGAVGLAALRSSGRTLVLASPPLAFTPLAAAGAGALGLAAIRRGEWRTAALLLAAAGALGAVVVPRTQARAQPAVDAPERVRILSANVFKGAGRPGELARLIAELSPDVVALQEQTPGYLRALDAAGLAEQYPHRVAGTGKRLNDAAVLSRHPLEPLEVELQRVNVGAVLVLPSGQRVPVVSAHPLPPADPKAEAHWIRALERLPGPAGGLTGGLIAGDFNATLDHPAFRRVLARGWRDAAAELGLGLRSTWQGQHLGLMRLTIDHVLVPPGAAVRELQIHPLRGSDHRVLTATVDLPGSG